MRTGSGRETTARQPAQSGVALITVLLVVALGTVAAVHMTRQTQLDLHRTGNRLALAQAHEIALGGEQWAASLLARLRRSEDYRGVDARNQVWAQELPQTPTEEARVTGSIQDMQGRFNINSLVDGDTINTVALDRFERLLATLELEPALSRAVIDWLDRNRETTYPGGAEDDYYLMQDPSHLSANRPAATATELRLVRGIDAAAWKRLAPHVTALPGDTPINVNTATPAVLQAVVPGLDEEAAITLSELMADEPFDDVGAFFDHSLVADTEAAREIDGTALGVGSSHFRIHVTVEMDELEYTLHSWLAREPDGSSRIFRRSRIGE